MLVKFVYKIHILRFGQNAMQFHTNAHIPNLHTFAHSLTFCMQVEPSCLYSRVNLGYNNFFSVRGEIPEAKCDEGAPYSEAMLEHLCW